MSELISAILKRKTSLSISPCIVKERYEAFDELDDLNFLIRFRLRKPTVLLILQLIKEQIETFTDRNHSISPINQLLLDLRFYATGSFFITIGDFIKVSKSAACRIVKKVSRALASLGHRFIKMSENKNDIILRKYMEFYEKANLPRIIGSIDCTHGGEHAELFRNRKGYFSINVQTVASTNLRIMDVVARWPGSTHD
ncbi:hypothetical protein NQ317_007927 [Molorchus minor]|uniref:DDE Tnp4 domain-containing protein n=1 Tax=Molorchus minor TaxID=1323400 RepID=A0ABQ9JS44_9CUCU|nr:hypothetical protein NQ317_007927 [Molorchus minor]